MNDLVTTSNNLPANIEDLSRYVLLGSEKLVSVRAEMRAISKLKLADEVYWQKLEERNILSELIIDAKARLGELMKEIPTSSGGRPTSQSIEQKTSSSTANSFEDKTTDTTVESFKPKHEVIKEMGFSKDQVSRFEILADNKDVIEEAKQMARANNDMVTQTNILSMVDIKKQALQEQVEVSKEKLKQLDEDYAIEKQYSKAMYAIITVRVNQETLEAWARTIKHEKEKKDILDNIAESIDTLQEMRVFLANKKIKPKE